MKVASRARGLRRFSAARRVHFSYHFSYVSARSHKEYLSNLEYQSSSQQGHFDMRGSANVEGP